MMLIGWWVYKGYCGRDDAQINQKYTEKMTLFFVLFYQQWIGSGIASVGHGVCPIESSKTLWLILN